MIIALAMILGLGLLLYPSIADYWNSFHQSRAIMTYMEDVSAMDPVDYEAFIESAREYNKKIASGFMNLELSEEQKEEYNAELNFDRNGIMGYIQIDKIGVMLPIYHGTSEQVLQTSIGHLEGTCLPVGTSSYDAEEEKVMDPEEGCHAVLSGHRGLPSAKLFTDLDKLVEGDTFTITVLNETFTYQVDQIRIVEPYDLSTLLVEKGEDLCTLVTCTPYGINTQRLLVRGRRVANPHGEVKVVADAIQIDRIYIAAFIAIPLVIALLVVLIITTGRASRRKRAAVETKNRYLED